MNRLPLLALFLPLACFGDDPFSCVDPDVRSAFLPGYPVAYAFSTELPEGFVAHAAPPSSRLIGSQSGANQMNAVYSVKGDLRIAIDRVADSITDPEWSETPNDPALARKGFQARERPMVRQFCNDDGPTILTVGSTNNSPSGMVRISTHINPNMRSCADLAIRRNYMETRSQLAAELPRLSLPTDVRSSGTGSGGNKDSYDSRIDVTSDRSRESLLAILNDQIRDQGWTYDISWSGDRSAGSTWTKSSADGEPPLGMLNAFGGRTGRLSLRFSIRRDTSSQEPVRRDEARLM